MTTHPSRDPKALPRTRPTRKHGVIFAALSLLATACAVHEPEASLAGACPDCDTGTAEGGPGGQPPSGSTGQLDAPCSEDVAEGVEVGDCAPEFALPDRDGNLVSLVALRGAPVLIEMVMMW